MSPLLRHAPAPAPVELASLLASLAQASPLEAFEPVLMSFFEAFSQALLAHAEARRYPELLALGFFMRRAELERLAVSWRRRLPEGARPAPRGLVFHVPPANVDTMFIYTWLLAALLGNLNVVRLSQRSLTPQVQLLLGLLNALLDEPRYAAVRQGLAIVSYGHEPEPSAALSRLCDVRVLWGGDAAIAQLRAFPLAPHAKELCFPHRTSLAALQAEAYLRLDEHEQQGLAEAFFRDAYGFDQRGCASPRLLVFCGGEDARVEASRRFFNHLQAEITRRGYLPEPSLLLAKQLATCQAILDHPVSALSDGGVALSVLSLPTPEAWRQTPAGGGLFFQCGLPSLAALAPYLRREDQTLCHFGFAADELEALLARLNGRALDRLVPIGQALNFEHLWDGYDLLGELSRLVRVKTGVAGA